MLVVGNVVAKLLKVDEAVRAVVSINFFIVLLNTVGVVKMIGKVFVGIESGTANWLPITVLALRKLCKRILSVENIVLFHNYAYA